MSQRRKAGDIALKRAGSGFIMRPGYVRIDPEARAEQYCSYRYQHEDDEPHRPPCCHDPDCQEWSDLRMLPGSTLAEAEENLRRGNFAGVACHVNECELADPPPELEENTEAA